MGSYRSHLADALAILTTRAVARVHTVHGRTRQRYEGARRSAQRERGGSRTDGVFSDLHSSPIVERLAILLQGAGGGLNCLLG